MSDLVLDASLALRRFLEDETDRKYGLEVLASLSSKRALVPALWFYEIGNGLLMAHRRKRIPVEQVDGFLSRLKTLPIDVAPRAPSQLLELPGLAQKYGLTNYDAAYLEAAIVGRLPLATSDGSLRQAALGAGVRIV
ncbi:MAG TPA: type II toxin-antitoxin system VapC family toxin [Candidatus Baltobacteraceae bacterium]|nr:type II toxin-antitoxin system VapC family toxin [Candidatus Baltobacteraceae bacterium]